MQYLSFIIIFIISSPYSYVVFFLECSNAKIKWNSVVLVIRLNLYIPRAKTFIKKYLILSSQTLVPLAASVISGCCIIHQVIFYTG